MLTLWGFTKNNIYEEFPKKGALGKFAGGLVKNTEGVFEGGLMPRCALT